MAVPDTPSVRLSDVIDEIKPSENSLEGCFAEADPDGFDPAYAKGGAEHWLSEFRNYGHRRWVTIRAYYPNANDKTLEATPNPTWLTVRQCIQAWTFQSGNVEVAVKRDAAGDHDYYIWRGYFAFDLRGLAGTAVEVELHLRRVSTSGTIFDCEIWRANWTDPLVAGDACAFVARMLAGARTFYAQGDSSIVHKIVSVSGDMGVFSAAVMDSMLTTILRHRYDHDDNPPLSGDYHSFIFYKGSSISQSLVWNAELRVKYIGDSFLNAFPDPLNWPITSGSADVYISANDKNNWSASVITGGAWLSIVGAATGEGSYKIGIDIAVNTVPGPPRSGTIKFESDDVVDYIVNVEQEGTRLTGSPDPWNAPPAGGDQVITVEANPTNSWSASVTMGGAWLSIFKGGSDTGDGEFTLLVTENDTESPRSGEVTIDHDGTNYIVNVEQNST